MRGIVTTLDFDVTVYGDNGLQATIIPHDERPSAVSMPLQNRLEVMAYRNKEGKVFARLQPYGTFLKIPKKFKFNPNKLRWKDYRND